MDCQTSGQKQCRCTYSGCSRRGNCRQCVAYHRGKNEFPACFFSAAAERSYDRSFKKLLEDRGL